MIIMIWERYFVKQFLKITILFLLGFYGLYILIDYASHTSALSYHSTKVEWRQVLIYYLCIFVSRVEILLPMALLIAFVKTVCTLNSRRELVALMGGGISIKRLLRPFIIIGLLSVVLLYVNEEFFLPKALKTLRQIEKKAKHHHHHHLQLTAQQIVLEDGSLLIFQEYDQINHRFFDVYWIASIDDIYHMKYLTINTGAPVGFFVDHICRQNNGELSQTEHHIELLLPQLTVYDHKLESVFIDSEMLSLATLAEKVMQIPYGDISDQESKLLTSFYWKSIIPWLCLLAIIAPAPFCVQFSRHLEVFFIYACTIFGFLAFYMFMDAARVVANNQILSPFYSIYGPFTIIFGYFLLRYLRPWTLK